MSPKARVVTFRPDDEDLAAMEALKERDGMPYSEQIRRALKMWLATKGVAKTERRRVSARQRS
jgi:predicted DNA binding CopG/RHH family protein